MISCAVTVQLICAFVLAYAKSRFSHDAAQLKKHTKVVNSDGTSPTPYQLFC